MCKFMFSKVNNCKYKVIKICQIQNEALKILPTPSKWKRLRVKNVKLR